MQENAYKILRELFQDGLSKNTRQEIRRWFFHGGDRERKDEALQRVWDQQIRRQAMPDAAVRKRFAALCQRLGIPDPGQAPAPEKKSIRYIRHRVLYRAATAAAVLLVGIAGATLFRFTTLSDAEPTTVRFETNHADQSPRMIELPCGTQVWLRGGSRLGFTDSPREVTLDGEACFAVEPNAEPFIVRTGHIDIKVLGTVFSVTDSENLDMLTVDLFAGAVELKTKNNTVTLGKGQRFEMNKNTLQWEIENLSWNTGRPDWVWTAMLAEDGVAFEEILNVIGHTYGMEVVNHRPDLSSGKYFFTLTEDMDADSAMDMLRLLNNRFTYRIENNVLIIE